MERDLSQSAKEYIVTAPYLDVGSLQLRRNEPIWVTEITNGQARIVHMGKHNAATPVSGWISVYSLEKRTNWRYEGPTSGVTVTQQPTTVIIANDLQPSPQVIIVKEERRYHRSRLSHHYHKRRNKAVIILPPIFW